MAQIGYFVTTSFISVVRNRESPQERARAQDYGRSQKHMSGPNSGGRYRLFAFAEENDKPGRGKSVFGTIEPRE